MKDTNQNYFTRRSACLGLSSVLFLSLSTKSFAHRLTTTETRVDISSKTGLIQIVHTFHTHDAGTALAKAKVIDTPDLTRLRQRAQMALYVSDNFSVFQNDKIVNLRLIGAELEKQNVLTYQEATLNIPLGQLSFSASMMREFVPQQINNVDVYIDNKVTSLQFRGADDRKNILA